MFHFNKLIYTLALGLVCLTGLAFAIAHCAVIPAFLVKTSPTGAVDPGTTIYLQVGVTPTPTSNQVVTITPDVGANYSSIPSTVTVLAGHSTADFQATLANSVSGSANLSASCNGGVVGCQIQIQH